MTSQTGPRTGIRKRHSRSSRGRRPLRWILASILAFAVLGVVTVAVIVKQPAPPPLTLPAGAATAPSGSAVGTWQVAAGSVAGFRVQETALGISNVVVGRTHAVAGTIVISGDQVNAATFRISLASIEVSGKTQPQFAKSLDTQHFLAATFTLARPVPLSPAFGSGATVTVMATGYLTMHGTSHLVRVLITGRRDGQALQAAGSIPVTFSEWGIKPPSGFSLLGSLADHGSAEFLLILNRH